MESLPLLTKTKNPPIPTSEILHTSTRSTPLQTGLLAGFAQPPIHIAAFGGTNPNRGDRKVGQNWWLAAIGNPKPHEGHAPFGFRNWGARVVLANSNFEWQMIASNDRCMARVMQNINTRNCKELLKIGECRPILKSIGSIDNLSWHCNPN